MYIINPISIIYSFIINMFFSLPGVEAAERTPAVAGRMSRSYADDDDDVVGYFAERKPLCCKAVEAAYWVGRQEQCMDYLDSSFLRFLYFKFAVTNEKTNNQY